MREVYFPSPHPHPHTQRPYMLWIDIDEKKSYSHVRSFEHISEIITLRAHHVSRLNDLHGTVSINKSYIYFIILSLVLYFRGVVDVAIHRF